MQKPKLEVDIMVVSALIEKIKKDLSTMWHSETELPEYVPGGYAGRTIPKNQVSIAIFIILTLMLALIFWNAAANTDTVGLDSGGSENALLINETWSTNGDTQEGQASDVDPLFKGRVNWTLLQLTWTDDDTSTVTVGGIGLENQPDTFRLTIVIPNGTEFEVEDSSDSSGNGVITIEIPLGVTEEEQKSGNIKDFEAGEWTITVECVEAGDAETSTGQTIQQDDGNDWTLNVNYNYYKKKGGDDPIPPE